MANLSLDLVQACPVEVGQDGGEYHALPVERLIQGEFPAHGGVPGQLGPAAATDRGIRLRVGGQRPGRRLQHVRHHRIVLAIVLPRAAVFLHPAHVDLGVEENGCELAHAVQEVEGVPALPGHWPGHHRSTVAR